MKIDSSVVVLTLTKVAEVNTDVDIKHILHVIGDDSITAMWWGISGLEWLGQNAAKLANALESAPFNSIVVSGLDLMQVVDSIDQTIEGNFVGYKSLEDAEEFTKLGWGMIHFEVSPAEIAIEIRDGTYIFISTRSNNVADRIRLHFTVSRD